MGSRILITNKELYTNPREIPPMYKYFSNIEFLEDVLKNERLYLINSTKCNDPYDSSVKLPMTLNELRQNEPNIDEDHPEVLQSDQTLLCCFSEYSDSIVMWSHYTDKHSGVAIEFDFKDNEFMKEHLIKVIYTDIFDTDNYYFAHITKSRQWEYEQEWRIVGAYYSEHVYDKVEEKGPNRYIDISGCIKSIMFGVNMDLKTKRTIVNMCKGKNINFYNARLSRDEYKIIFRKSTIK